MKRLGAADKTAMRKQSQPARDHVLLSPTFLLRPNEWRTFLLQIPPTPKLDAAFLIKMRSSYTSFAD